MSWLLRLDLWLLAIGALFIIRQLAVVLSAEQGRKQDLVKKLYKANQDFQVTVLIPFLNPQDQDKLAELLEAIHEQDYPTTKVSVQVVTTPETQPLLDRSPSVRPNVRLWQHPSGSVNYGEAITWLIERRLASGGSGLFLFLKADDMIKPDYFQNIVARGFDSFVVQGYVALRNYPSNPFAKVIALSQRLINRIGNAGRYHLGLSCRLMDSGWAIKQEVLEMIPFHRGMDLDNLEYTLRLNLENFRVNWAPNVVVYSNDNIRLLEYLTQCTSAFFNRVGLLFRYGPRLLLQTVLRMDLSYLESIFSILKPPTFLVGTALLAMAAITWTLGDRLLVSLGEPAIWILLTASVLVLEILAMCVARCKPHDFAVLLFWTPIVYMASLLALPIALFQNAAHAFRQFTSGKSKFSYRHAKITRLNEDIEATPDFLETPRSKRLIHELLESNAPVEEYQRSTDNKQNKLQAKSRLQEVSSRQAASPAISSPPPRARLPREQVKTVQLSNGKRQIECLLRAETRFNEQNQEFYTLSLEYKSMSFSTAAYRIMDQAYYELHAKLISRGLTLLTCGSCGNFYNPTADVPGALKNAGVCLFGKTGKEVNLSTDAVTVLSQACQYHCSLEQREKIVRQWKESLTQLNVR